MNKKVLFVLCLFALQLFLYNFGSANIDLVSNKFPVASFTPHNTDIPSITPTFTLIPSATYTITPPPTFTLVPTSTLVPRFTLVPSAANTRIPIPTSVPRQETRCPQLPDWRLGIGIIGRVIDDNDDTGNRIRSAPSLSAPQVALMAEGQEFVVLESIPTCADDYTWWHISYVGIQGWTAEGDEEEYWLEPVSSETNVTRTLNVPQSRAAYQPFESGYMMWLEETDQIFVLRFDGTWDAYNDAFTGDQGGQSTATGRQAPVRGFLLVWDGNPTEVRDAIGYGLSAEIGYRMDANYTFTTSIRSNGRVRVNGTVTIYDPNRHPFVLDFDGTWDGG